MAPTRSPRISLQFRASVNRCNNQGSCAFGRPPGGSLAFPPGGKSGLHRAACRLTAGDWLLKGPLRISATENIPPFAFAGGKGEMVR